MRISRLFLIFTLFTPSLLSYAAATHFVVANALMMMQFPHLVAAPGDDENNKEPPQKKPRVASRRISTASEHRFSAAGQTRDCLALDSSSTAQNTPQEITETREIVASQNWPSFRQHRQALSAPLALENNSMSEPQADVLLMPTTHALPSALRPISLNQRCFVILQYFRRQRLLISTVSNNYDYLWREIRTMRVPPELELHFENFIALNGIWLPNDRELPPIRRNVFIPTEEPRRLESTTLSLERNRLEPFRRSVQLSFLSLRRDLQRVGHARALNDGEIPPLPRVLRGFYVHDFDFDEQGINQIFGWGILD
jgi:hypothetical protein